ncbi:hypothetical protein M0R45_005627 [Rubus argutus]|uniref:Uncharacterized protein n=1 Tax=Rubus argutus TaxID=59490 RepID=A0AAW1YNT4_RUBAR
MNAAAHSTRSMEFGCEQRKRDVEVGMVAAAAAFDGGAGFVADAGCDAGMSAVNCKVCRSFMMLCVLGVERRTEV